MGEDHPPASLGLQIGRAVLLAAFLAFGVLAWRNGSWFSVAVTAVGVAAAAGALVKGKAMRPQDREAYLWRLKGGAAGLGLALVLLTALAAWEALGS